VVDDNVDAADALGRLLSRFWGQDARVAYDGPAALEIARSFRPEVVLLDIGLPGMDGCEVARRLRGEPESADALLVAVTGWGQELDREMSRGAGFDHHLVKPVEPERLREILATAAVPIA
jgi:CheY-like chemotaxis protein